eukprot:TRINITY_DN4874_c0_g2_i1.p1 TRINITY_DN4874_c0_g2~~TRINITY_DN4874_c0_g2_i1.p1  ORF type:complete len:161 (+),score=35.60 TRINITY_DN4874_c0_g2_i1:264-746(+)
MNTLRSFNRRIPSLTHSLVRPQPLTQYNLFPRKIARTNIQYASYSSTSPTTQTQTPKKEVDVLITPEEVARHNTLDDLWTAIHGDVYNLTGYVDEHPGGDTLYRAAGKDGTKLFEEQGHSDEARVAMKKWKIGKLLSGKPRYSEASPTAPTDPVVGKPGY